ncbi:hypothetical protein [Bradyrhizobium sp. 18]|uniref:hypothetical protein n=1 Tax=Bradyrhizobium sp. 18 TaxID=2782657 RepID=UPI001FFB065D|nr:hypothetical protein [Bradyrhizobium sp. 18]MCK1503898.1 hypothetical protein [Bradyrhizobium sp. 18]
MTDHPNRSADSRDEPDGPCFYCGEATSSYAGDPGRWPLRFCQRDGTGITRYHHTRCVTDRIHDVAQPAPSYCTVDGPQWCEERSAGSRCYNCPVNDDLRVPPQPSPAATVETRSITDEDRNYASELLADLANGDEPRLQVAAQWFCKARVEHSLPRSSAGNGEPPLSVQDVQQEFYVWWADNQEDPAHGMITQNCALATWKGAYDKYVRNTKHTPDVPPRNMTKWPDTLGFDDRDKYIDELEAQIERLRAAQAVSDKDLLNWIENEASRGLTEGDAREALTAIKWKIKDGR